METHNAMPVPDQSSGPVDDEAEAGHPVEDLAAAIIFIVVAAGAFVIALDYPIGTLHRMGPGMFPLLISGLLTAIGVGLVVQSLVAWRLRAVSSVVPELVPNLVTVRALFVVMVSLLAFAVLVRPAGLFIATGVLAFIATRTEPGRGVVGSLILSLALSCITAAIFVYGIGVPIPLWP